MHQPQPLLLLGMAGPYDNNYYLGPLFQLDKDADTQNVELAKGDTLLGDTLRSTLAEVSESPNLAAHMLCNEHEQSFRCAIRFLH